MQIHARLSRSLLLALLFVVFVPLVAQAYSAGTARTNGCGGCHGNRATGDLGVSISGPAELGAGATATYTLSIDPSLAGGGFSVTSGNGGAFVSVIDANTTAVNGNVSHAAANSGDWSYNFDLTAPDVAGATITLSFAGMAFNGDFSGSRDDLWNVGTYLVNVVSVVPEPATGLLVGLGIGMLALAGRRRKA